MASFREKVFLVTGASSGIGEATAIKLAEHGATLFLVALEEDKLQIVQQKCMKKGLVEEKLTPSCMLCTYHTMKEGFLAGNAQLGPHGVRVNAINPGFIDDTNILRNSSRKTTDEDQKKFADKFANLAHLKRAGKPADVVSLLLFLASDEASDITGSINNIDGKMLRVLLSIEIRNSSGIEVESFINSASSVIAAKASYKFRVLGEAKIIAIFEVYDDTVVNTVTADIMRMGPYNVTCTPLIGIERLAQMLSLDYQRVLPNRRRLSQKYVVWYELPMNNQGISPELCYTQWKKDVISLIEKLQYYSLELEMFKALGERRLYVFTCVQNYEDWEYDMAVLPFGDKSKLLTHL